MCDSVKKPGCLLPLRRSSANAKSYYRKLARAIFQLAAAGKMLANTSLIAGTDTFS
jgi:hypothetical protein